MTSGGAGNLHTDRFSCEYSHTHTRWQRLGRDRDENGLQKLICARLLTKADRNWLNIPNADQPLMWGRLWRHTYVKKGTVTITVAHVCCGALIYSIDFTTRYIKHDSKWYPGEVRGRNSLVLNNSCNSRATCFHTHLWYVEIKVWTGMANSLCAQKCLVLISPTTHQLGVYT